MGGRRDLVAFGGLAALYVSVFLYFGAAYSTRMLVEATCYALIALGLTIQWGYAGLFNVGIMGLVAIGGFCAMLISYPTNPDFLQSDGPSMLLGVLLRIMASVVIIIGIRRLDRLGISKKPRTILQLIVFAACYLWVTTALDAAATHIEDEAGFVGGMGLPVLLGWAIGAIAAGIIAYGIGRICLGLRSDYLAIATLGIAEIIKHFLKNADWLTRGTLTVSPLEWPVPTPVEIGFVASRAAYLSVTAILVVATYFLLERALNAPWGRMIRAIRENETAASAMGKNVERRRLEIFVFGALLMGLGGAALVTFSSIFDPSGFLPLNHTFLIWVMVILGGSGNNRGAIFGALFVYLIWTLSEPATLYVFDLARVWGDALVGWEAPSDLDSRALQMRVFVIGLTITLVLRFAPDGILPEVIRTSGDKGRPE